MLQFLKRNSKLLRGGEGGGSFATVNPAFVRACGLSVRAKSEDRGSNLGGFALVIIV